MQIAKQIPALLLALVFIVFGLNFFLNFLEMPPMGGDSATFFTLFGGTGYMKFIKILEIGFGLLLLMPKTRALGLILIAPIIVNIVCFELFIAKQPGLGIALLAINAIGIYLNRDKYIGIIK
jgi:putative oxidoreductase